MALLIPGQPVPLLKGPAPQLGHGLYIREGQVRASLVGIPENQGSVLKISRARPNAPAPNSSVLGTITRLSPAQATLSISVVDGVALPPGEEFQGLIRVQDVRAQTVKISDCFRGGDVVKGLVVRIRVC